MGGIRRQRKKIVTPGHPYDKARLERELPLVGEYGLRNKKELWKASTILSTARKQARTLLSLDPDVRSQRENELLSRLSRIGLLPKGSDLDSVLSLDVRVVLERRLQTLVHRKGLAATPYQARQFIAHRHIALGDGVVTTPSRLITVSEEEKLGYAPRSPLNDGKHPSRPQAPPVIPEFEEQKKAEEEKAKPKEEKPKAKPATKPKEEKPKAKPATKPKEEKPKAKPATKPKEEKPKAKPAAKPKVEKPKAKPAAKPKAEPKEKKEEAKPAAKPKAPAVKKTTAAKKTTTTSSKKEESK